MNSPDTIERRMQQAGLPYDITGQETPLFILSGGTSVVALWRDSRTDDERAFAGFYSGGEAAECARQARKVRGVYAAYVVSASEEL